MSSLEGKNKSVVGYDFFYNSTDINCVVDSQGGIERANKAFIKELGYTHPEGIVIWNLIHEFNAGIESDKDLLNVQGEVCLKTANGSQKWYQVKTFEKEDSDNHYFSGRFIGNDKKEELEYLNDFYNFQDYFHNSPDLVARYDKEYRHIYVNPATEKYTGIPNTQIIGKTHYELGAPKELADVLQSPIREVFKLKKRIHKRQCYPTHAGMQHMEALLIPEFLPDQSDVNTVLVVSRNVTELENAHRKIQEQIRRTRLVADIGEQVLKGVFLKEMISPTLKRVKDIVHADLCLLNKYEPGKKAFSSIAPFPADNNNIHEQVTMPENGLGMVILKSDEPVLVYDFYNDSRFVISPLLAKRNMKSGVFAKVVVGGQPFGFLGIYSRNVRTFSEEIVEFVKHVANLIATVIEKEKAEKILVEKNKDLEAFIYKVSHDLKAPLSSIKGLLNVAFEDAGDSPLLQYLKLMDKTVDKMDRSLLDLLDLVKVKEGILKKSKVNLKQVTEEILESLNNLENYDRLNIRVEVPEDITIETDKALITSILQNLISNSINYQNLLEGAPYLGISAVLKSDVLTIIIEDNGLGIDPGLQSKIFDKFVRGQSGIKGSGLGLFIVKTAVARLNGVINLESRPTKPGTKFIVSLPAFLAE